MTTTGAEQDRDELWAYGYSYREIEAMDRFDAFEAGAPRVLAGCSLSEARENLKGWVLLVSRPTRRLLRERPLPKPGRSGGPRRPL